MDQRRGIQNVMIKPAHDCNMNCDYCFVKNLTEDYREQRMSLDTLNEAYKVLSASAEEVHIIWHGGEPTLMGSQWYKDAIELSYLYSDKTKFTHSMQSNGLLIDEGWLDLIENYNVSLAVSFDGLFQDYRKEGTKEIVEGNLINMKKQLGHAGCLSVVTENSYKGMIDNYEYFKDKGVQVFYNYGINGDYSNRGNFEGAPLESYMKEFVNYFKHWMNDSEGYAERSCIHPIEKVMGLGGGCCSTSDCRYRWLNINPDGTTSHCNRYFPEEYGMGQIEEARTVDDLYNTKEYKLLDRAIQKRFELYCNNCEYLKYCKGGCNSNHLMNSGQIEIIDVGYCNRFKLEFNEVYKILRNIDIYSNDNLNPSLLQIFSRGTYTLKEINNCLKLNGLGVRGIKFDGENLLTCQEFQIFRVFNPSRESSYNGHSDYIEAVETPINEVKEEFITPNIRDRRMNDMNVIFKNNFNLIQVILEGSKEDLI